jgi:nucleoside 2-deoxyribosyltransferase
MKIYLAGPMRGVPLFNFPAFHEAAATLRGLGHEVFSPAEKDAEAGQDGTKPALAIAHYMAIDLPEVCQADAVVVLPGYENSQGCKIELAVAKEIGKPVLEYPKLYTLTHPFRIVKVKI